MMTFLKHRRSLRLKGYDYSQVGAYFITICVKNRKCLLGSVLDDRMQLNSPGRIAAYSWNWLSQAYDIELDEYVIMPNHLHGIIIITNCRGGSRTAPTGAFKVKPLGRLIGAFKTISTKHINLIHKISGVPLWQRNFYEHVIRDDHSLNRIRDYIVTNPLRWDLDRENPQACGMDEFDTWLAAFKRPPDNAGSTVGAVREPPPKAGRRR
jgi:putative transposase